MDNSTLQCQVCAKAPSSLLPFYCLTCARNILYEPRVEHAQLLLSKEALAKEVEQAVKAGKSDERLDQNAPGTPNSHGGVVNRIYYEQAKARQSESSANTQSILEVTESLHGDVKKIKEDISTKKASLFARRAALGDARKELTRVEDQTIEPLRKDVALVRGRWDTVHGTTAEVRVLLCKEVAALYGLQQRKRKKGIPGRDLYLIGGVPIVDLRDLNNTPPHQISASITSVAHLLHLTSHYLSLRLPAEIIPPSVYQPHAIINTPLSSHKNPTLYPAQKHGYSTTPRPRILHLDRPLLTLASEDPIAYSLFVDAVTLLAWDIAWLAKTQGIEVGLKSWEEVCGLGKNMWALFGPSSSTSGRPAVSRATTTTSDMSPFSRSPSTPDPAVPLKLATTNNSGPTPGRFSHNSSHSFLAAAGITGGADFMRGWHFANPIRLIERIKSALYSERMGAEWEVLEKNEWEADEQVLEIDNGKGEDNNVTKGVRRDSLEVDKNNGNEERRRVDKQKRGWTKVKSQMNSDV